MEEPDLDPRRFVALVRSRADVADAIALVDVASTVSRELIDAADLVIDHFVLEARAAGHSWTAIGQRLGMSKQAARQRFGTRPMPMVESGDLEVMPRLQACMDQARVEVEDGGSGAIDTHHLLLGLLQVGLAAAALDRLGITRDRVRDSVRRLFGEPTGAARDGEPELSVDARQALHAAETIAREHGHGHIGTEHLLFVLSTDPGSQARRVLNDLGVETAAIKRELEPCLGARPRRRRRRRKETCSFCGRSKSQGVRLVGGPGVCICDQCVRLASNTLSQLNR